MNLYVEKWLGTQKRLMNESFRCFSKASSLDEQELLLEKREFSKFCSNAYEIMLGTSASGSNGFPAWYSKTAWVMLDFLNVFAKGDTLSFPFKDRHGHEVLTYGSNPFLTMMGKVSNGMLEQSGNGMWIRAQAASNGVIPKLVENVSPQTSAAAGSPMTFTQLKQKYIAIKEQRHLHNLLINDELIDQYEEDLKNVPVNSSTVQEFNEYWTNSSTVSRVDDSRFLELQADIVRFFTIPTEEFYGDCCVFLKSESNWKFMKPIAKWICDSAANSVDSYTNFLELSLPDICEAITELAANSSRTIDGSIICSRLAGKQVNIKNFMNTIQDNKDFNMSDLTYSEMAEFAKKVNRMSADRDVQTKDFSKDFEVVPVTSFEQFNQIYSQPTGWNGKGAWCHACNSSTYYRWMENGKNMLFVVQLKNWKDIQPPKDADGNLIPAKQLDSPYDEYGMSAIAILVKKSDCKLLKSTLRYNHLNTPPTGNPDRAFKTWKQLNDATGIDVEKICKDYVLNSIKQNKLCQT